LIGDVAELDLSNVDSFSHNAVIPSDKSWIILNTTIENINIASNLLDNIYRTSVDEIQKILIIP